MDEERTWTPSRLIGLGCVLCLLLCATCTGGTCYYAARDVVVVGPRKVEQMADRILPGAAPLPGQRGYFASRIASVEMAVLADRLNEPEAPKEQLRGTVFYLFAVDKPRDQRHPDWQKVERHFGSAPGSWGRELRHEFVELSVDGRKVKARRYWTDDGRLNYRLDLLTVDRAVVLIVSGPEGSFDEQGLRRFLNRVDLDRPQPRPTIRAFPIWLAATFLVLGAGLLVAGAYIVKETTGDRPAEDSGFEL